MYSEENGLRSKNTFARDSISPVSFITRAQKTTNGIVTRGSHMTVVLFSGAFINIYNKINEISKNEENEENLLIDASRED